VLLQTAKPTVAAGNNKALSQPDTQVATVGGNKPGGEQVTAYRLKLR
jgi:hypothetical protein